MYSLLICYYFCCVCIFGAIHVLPLYFCYTYHVILFVAFLAFSVYLLRFALCRFICCYSILWVYLWSFLHCQFSCCYYCSVIFICFYSCTVGIFVSMAALEMYLLLCMLCQFIFCYSSSFGLFFHCSSVDLFVAIPVLFICLYSCTVSLFVVGIIAL